MKRESTNVTQLLQSIDAGRPAAADELLPLVYDELRKLAKAKMASQIPGQTLQATALVHEAWLRLTHRPDARWENKRHFFRAAAEAMRCILIDQARRKKRVRHGGDLERIDLANLELAANTSPETNLAIDEALARLAEIAPEKAELVKLRFYIGLSNEEAAQTLDISLATAKRYWSYSRAWLFSELRKPQAPTVH